MYCRSSPDGLPEGRIGLTECESSEIHAKNTLRLPHIPLVASE